jgi:hypothetical protein
VDIDRWAVIEQELSPTHQIEIGGGTDFLSRRLRQAMDRGTATLSIGFRT